MTGTEDKMGRTVLSIAHIAGMIDLVALPVWVGALIGAYHFSPRQAGGLVTLFLVGVVLSSVTLAPRFSQIGGRAAAAGGFALAAVAFAGLSVANDFRLMAALHFFGGVTVGCGLSFTHGTIGRSANAHRLFAVVNVALGVFAMLFLGGVPQVMQHFGRESLFQVFAGVMLVAAIASAIGFPKANALVSEQPDRSVSTSRLSAGVWFGIVGIATMTMTQSMMFSFVERIGVNRGFAHDLVVATLVAVGFVNLFPAVLAAILERKWPATRVLIAGPLSQAFLAMVITQSTAFAPFAVATSVFVFVMLFTHTFAFGLLARMDATSRAVAATPAMLMTGSAVGPILGGVLVQKFGYESLGFAVIIIAMMGVVCFSRVGSDPTAAHSRPAAI